MTQQLSPPPLPPPPPPPPPEEGALSPLKMDQNSFDSLPSMSLAIGILSSLPWTVKYWVALSNACVYVWFCLLAGFCVVL